MNNILKTYYIKTFGCQMNYSDSERISTVLKNIGLEKTNDIEEADILIFNTCSVRQSAEDRIWGLQKNIRKLKLKRNIKLCTRKYKLPLTILTGCMCKRSRNTKISILKEKGYLDQLKSKALNIDIFLKIEDICKLTQILRCQKKYSHPNNYLKIKPDYSSKYKAYVLISTGCDEFCSYCIVPYARGEEKDRSSEEIISEIKKLVSKGYKDIMLLGQSANSWKNRKKQKPRNFLELLRELDKIEGNFWLSYLSSHPFYFTQGLVDYFAYSCNKGTEMLNKNLQLTTRNHIRPYLNLAMQSGSNKILYKMNRKYTISKFVSICKKLKKIIPNLNLSTDIIVGFPGESKEDFQKTKDVFELLKFDMAYINKYSQRNGTLASQIEDNIKLKEKKRREKELTKILKMHAFENNKKYIGQIHTALTDTIKKENEKYYVYGKLFNFKDIKIRLKNYNDAKVGEFVRVKIIKAKIMSLEGVII